MCARRTLLGVVGLVVAVVASCANASTGLRSQDAWERRAAAEKTDDANGLVELLRREQAGPVADAAWTRLMALTKAGAALSPDVPRELATTAPQEVVRRRAIGILSDEQLLAKSAATDNLALVRGAAVERLSDPATIVRLLRVERDSLVTLPGWQQLMKVSANGTALSPLVVDDLARHAASEHVRVPALRLSKNQEVLKAALRADREDERAAALENLSDAALILEAATKDQSVHVRRTAIRSGRFDQKTIGQIVRSDPSREIVTGAVGQLKDGAIVRGMLRDDSVAEFTRILLMSNPGAEPLHEELATRESNPAVRNAAVGHLTKEALLLKVAAHDADAGIRRNAATRLNNLRAQALKERLARDAQPDRDVVVRRIGQSCTEYTPSFSERRGSAHYDCRFEAVNRSASLHYMVSVGVRNDACDGGASESLAPGKKASITLKMACHGGRPQTTEKGRLPEERIVTIELGEVKVNSQVWLSFEQNQEIFKQVNLEIAATK